MLVSLIAQATVTVPDAPTPYYPSGGGSWGWISSLAHELGPMGFFAVLMFVALAYVWWCKAKETVLLRERFQIVLELQATFASILSKMCKRMKPPVDVEQEMEDIDELIDMARRPHDERSQGDKRWWKRLMH